MKTYLLRISLLTWGFVSFFWGGRNPTFSNICFHVPDTFLWLLNYESYVHVYVSFRCISLIGSSHLSKHPSLCELFWCPSPDDGYWIRNVNVDFTSKYIHLFGLCFFCYLHTVGFNPCLLSYIYIYNLVMEEIITFLFKRISFRCEWKGSVRIE